MEAPSLKRLVLLLDRPDVDPKLVRFSRAVLELHEATIDMAVRDISARVMPMVLALRDGLYAGMIEVRKERRRVRVKPRLETAAPGSIEPLAGTRGPGDHPSHDQRDPPDVRGPTDLG